VLTRLGGTVSALLAFFVMSACAAHAAPTSAAGQMRMAIDSASRTADFSATAGRNRFVILNEWEQTKMRRLKATNPALKVLMYKDLAFVATGDSHGNVNTGVTAAEADANPSWYLRNTSGQRFSSWSYDWLMAADVGNQDYQQRWADNVLGKLQTQGWDGVFVDDANPTMRHHYDVDAVAKYPSDASYGAATGSALATIGPKLRGAGKLVIPNFGDWRLHRDVVDPWLDHVSGGMEEHFTKYGNSPTAGYYPKADWELQLGALKDAEAKGKYFLGLAHSGDADAAAARFGWATALLGANGRTSFALAADYTSEPASFPEYDYDIGEPVAPESVDASGVHRRAFSKGLVLVNPTGAPVEATLGGTYSGSGLDRATVAKLGPSSALVLTRDSAESAGAASEITTTITTTTTPVTAPSPSRSRGTTTVSTKVAKRGKSSPTARVTRKRASCPARARSCRVRVSVKVKRAGKLCARGSRRTVLRGGRARTVAVRVFAVASSAPGR